MAESASVGGTLRLHTGEVDLGRQRLVSPEGVVSLTTRETELLGYLAARAGDPVSRESLLTDVWNYRASNPTRAVDLAVKRLRAKIEPDPSEPVHVLSVHGVGYRFVPLDSASPLPPPAQAQAPSPTNLVPERTSFVGRATELARLSELLGAGTRLITITGSAGTGKTRLARRLGSEQFERFGGVWFVDLSGVRASPGEGAAGSCVEGVLSALAGVLKLPTGSEAGPSEVGRALADRARGGALLLVLDNFEHLVEHASQLLGLWLDLAPDVRFVVTSRERLHVRGERILELQPLPSDDALELLIERAAAVRRGLVLSGGDRDVLAEVVAQLDGIPLAIELAASRLGTLSPVQLRKRLASRFRLLGDPRSDRPARHATLEAALDWSWGLMGPEDQRALAALSVFEGGFSLEAAEEVLDDPDDPEAPWPADLIQSLRDKSLLAMDDLVGGDLRYRLLESIRAYAARKLEQRGEGDAVRLLHARYYLREGEELTARLHTARGVDRMEDLAREQQNLIVVARQAPEPQMQVRAMLCLFPVLQARGPLVLLEELMGRAIELSRQLDGLDELLLGRLLADRGIHHFGRGRLNEAEADFLEASEVAGTHADVSARALLGVGRVRQAQGRLDEAAEAMEGSIARFSRLGDRSGEGRARALFATVLTGQGLIDEAQAEYERALACLRRVSDRWTEGILYANLAGFLLEKMHDPHGAERRATQALEMLSEIGDHRACVMLLTGFGVACVRMGRATEALEKLEAAAELARRMGDRAQEGSALVRLGWALFELERIGEAEQRTIEAMALLRDDPDRGRLAVAMRMLGCVRQEQQRWLEAEQSLTESLRILRQEENQIEHAVGALQLALLQLERGEHEAAEALLSEASERAGHQLPWLLQQAIAARAVMLAEQRRLDEAEALARSLERSVDPRDPREQQLLLPTETTIALAVAHERDRQQLPAVIEVAESLLAAEVGQRGASERRLVLRLLARGLGRVR